MAQGKDLELAWADADRDQISIPNPFAARHTVAISVASAVWTDTDRVFVDVSYKDEENGIFESKAFKFPVRGGRSDLPRGPGGSAAARRDLSSVTFFLQGRADD